VRRRADCKEEDNEHGGGKMVWRRIDGVGENSWCGGE
jgi:hypothetical protein